MIGVDVIEIERLERALERRPGLAERIFSQGELAYARTHRRPGRHLAARFAAKEAAVKALGIGGLALHEVEVLGGGDTQPRLALTGRALRAAEELGMELEVSLSHSRELAIAAVIGSRTR
ncbi:MAG TPA: holo-ACP synthase [Solirubrobacterales bacterium]|nr:holo-ACP synthase [Solirubrobacterales bacterium]